MKCQWNILPSFNSCLWGIATKEYSYQLLWRAIVFPVVLYCCIYTSYMTAWNIINPYAAKFKTFQTLPLLSDLFILQIVMFRIRRRLRKTAADLGLNYLPWVIKTTMASKELNAAIDKMSAHFAKRSAPFSPHMSGGKGYLISLLKNTPGFTLLNSKCFSKGGNTCGCLGIFPSWMCVTLFPTSRQLGLLTLILPPDLSSIEFNVISIFFNFVRFV